MKKILSMVLVLVIIATMIPAVGVSAETEGYFTYTVSDGEAKITGVDKSISGDVVIPDTLGGFPVKVIYSYAFSGCNEITGVTIPGSVNGMGEGVFYGCKNLKSVIISEGIASIGNRAFANCEALINITIPDSVTYIDDYAFYNTGYSVDDSNWDNDALYIGKHLCEVKDSASGEFSVKEGTLTIAGMAFINCSNLTGVTIPNSVITIGDAAFEGCTGITSITIPNSVISIGSRTFYDCTSLLSIVIPDSVVEIGTHAFGNCTSIKTITIPDSVTNIGGSAFENCISLQYIDVSENNAVYKSVDGVLFTKTGTVIKLYPSCKTDREYIIPSGVTTIEGRAFENCTDLTSVIIPDGVTYIDSLAFNGCTNLTAITIPDSVTALKSGAFNNIGYTNDESNWENGVLYIGNHLIKVKPSVSGEFVIKYGTITIGDDAFGYCESLTRVTIPDTVTTIGVLAFAYCSNLTNVDIGNSVTTIGDKAFYACSKLTGVNIPDSMITIGKWAFYLCPITDIDIPDGVTTIGDGAFSYCDITSITIPESVTNIGDGVFYYCSKLTNIIVEENNSVYRSEDGVLFTKDGTTLIRYPINKADASYTIPDGVLAIDGAAFEMCSKLTSVIIADSVTTIGAYAFTCSGLINVTIPDGVTNIDNGAFERCTGLTSIIIPDSVTNIGIWAFDMCDSLTLSCYKGSYAEEYAIANNVPYEIIMDTPGDADGDSTITLADVTLLLQKIAGWGVEVIGDADANADGNIDLNDATLLLQYIAGWNVTLGSQK